MPYIDETYYNDTYKGTTVDDPAELTRYLETASIVIDNITHYALIDDPTMATFADWIAERVRKATAAQVDAFARAGGIDALTESSNADPQTVTVGRVAITKSPISASVVSSIAPLAYEYLRPTGMLFSGVKTYGF